MSKENALASLDKFKELDTRIKDFNKKHEPAKPKYLSERLDVDKISTAGLVMQIAAPTSLVAGTVFMIASAVAPLGIVSDFANNNALAVFLTAIGVPPGLFLLSSFIESFKYNIATFFGFFTSRKNKAKWKRNAVVNRSAKESFEVKLKAFKQKRRNLESKMNLILEQANASMVDKKLVYYFDWCELKLEDKEIPDAKNVAEHYLAGALEATKSKEIIKALTSKKAIEV